MKTLIVAILLGIASLAQAGEKITIAAAADLRFAMDEIVKQFRAAQPDDIIDVIYGSSGKFFTQIQQGAPYDLFFSADIGYPRELEKSGFAGAPAVPYATGRIVLWSPSRDASKMTLKDLADPKIGKVAIANPQHAPYGKRAEEALKAQGLWETVSAKAVYGENISQTAQFVQTGNAEVGIIALSLAVNPALVEKGGYYLIPDNLHQPLEQGFVVLKHAADNPLAKRFATYMGKPEARAVMKRYGFILPSEAASK
jgi:molybdate transport system substrate-binding protein